MRSNRQQRAVFIHHSESPPLVRVKTQMRIKPCTVDKNRQISFGNKIVFCTNLTKALSFCPELTILMRDIATLMKPASCGHLRNCRSSLALSLSPYVELILGIPFIHDRTRSSPVARSKTKDHREQLMKELN